MRDHTLQSAARSRARPARVQRPALLPPRAVLNLSRPVLIASLLLFLLAAPDPAEACRFWAVIGSGYPENMIDEHLRSGSITNLRELSSSNRDGWGVASFPVEPGFECLNLPLIRRGRPPANWYSEYKYDLAVDEMVCLQPRAALAHVRHAGSSPHSGGPDPHPFSHERWMFAHNGSMRWEALDSLLTLDDIHYLNDHPPEYVNGYIDSELYFLYVLKVMHQEQGSIEQSLVRAVRDVALATNQVRRLNFVLTAGDTLYTVRFAPGDSSDPVVYCPATLPRSGERSSWYAVASQVVGSTLSGWGEIPPRSLGVFVPGESPRFLPIFDPASVQDGRGPQPTPGEEASGAGSTICAGPAAPNPGPGEVRLPFRLAQAEPVRCEIWSVDGRLVRSFSAGNLPAGEHVIRWDGLDQSGADAPSGQYFWRIRTGDGQETRRVTLVR